ncbi:hypothetical protein NPIL_381501 [Nephila pilipes]|uniref:Uncharacterized protein n=1 Tax=Nephila pilipes TaxID=299642 RepID=A0A8X6QBD3_NEPPI|nr:hypothetical protein NPIL_381501 [Nephila pilipes]
MSFRFSGTSQGCREGVVERNFYCFSEILFFLGKNPGGEKNALANCGVPFEVNQDQGSADFGARAAFSSLYRRLWLLGFCLCIIHL